MSDTRTSRDVSIGCGSLFLIALIVWFFSGSGKRLENDVQAVRQDVQELKVLVLTQTDEIRALRAAQPVKP